MFHRDLSPLNFYLGFLGVDRIPWLNSSTYSPLAIMIADVWRNVGFFVYSDEVWTGMVILCNTDGNPEKHKSYLEIMRSQQAAGMIIIPTHPKDAEVLLPVRDAGTPIVFVDREIAGFEADTVMVDNLCGAELAVNHLIQLGYERIAILAGSQDITPGRERLQVYYNALDAAGIEPNPELIKTGTFKSENGAELTYQLMNSPNPPDAIFASNNLTALGCLRALHDLQVRIPDEVVLVSFDDMS